MASFWENLKGGARQGGNRRREWRANKLPRSKLLQDFRQVLGRRTSQKSADLPAGSAWNGTYLRADASRQPRAGRQTRASP